MNDLEGCIYKYGACNNIERTLTRLTLPFSDLASYNDIYEDEFHLVLNVRRDNIDELNGGTRDTPNRIRQIFEEQLKKYRVTCFSKRADIALMWSHYADRHKGICYCFDYSVPDPIFDYPIDRGLVKYSNQLPDIHVYQNDTRDTMIRRLTSDVVRTKPIEWAYEQEIRFWYDSAAMALPQFDPVSLRALIVGRRVEDCQLREITEWLAQYNESHGTEVQILYAHRIKGLYEIGICGEKSERDFHEDAKNNSALATVSDEGNSLFR